MINILESAVVGNSAIALTTEDSIQGILKFKLTWSAPKNNMAKSFTFMSRQEATRRFNNLFESLTKHYQDKSKSGILFEKEVANGNSK